MCSSRALQSSRILDKVWSLSRPTGRSLCKGGSPPCSCLVLLPTLGRHCCFSHPRPSPGHKRRALKQVTHMSMELVEISEGKPHQSGFWMQMGRRSRTTQGNHGPTRRTLPREGSQIPGPHRKRLAPHLLQEVSSPGVRSGINHHHPKLQCFSSGLCFRTLPTSSFLSTKPRSSPSCVGLACGLAIACVFQTAILCYSQINHSQGESDYFI